MGKLRHKIWSTSESEGYGLKIPPPIFFFFWKKRKVLRIAWFGEKIDQNFCLKILPPPRDLLGFFKATLQTRAERRVKRVRTREPGPPSALAEINN